MLIVNLLVNEKLLNAEAAFNRADSDGLIEACRYYLLLLNEYREALYRLRSAPDVNKPATTPLARELTEQVRRAIRSAVEITTRERNHAEKLLESLTVISGYEALETFNYLTYKGSSDWIMRAGGLRPKNGPDEEIISIEKAVETASTLRCTEYAVSKTTFLRNPIQTNGKSQG